MAQAQALVLFSSLLTICVSEGSPEVWVRVQMEATGLPSLSLSVRCGVLGTNFISLVTVIWERFVDAQGTKLAVLHPELGTQRWGPTSQARWETSNSISLTLTLEQSKAKTSLANTTFCCEFVTFPHGSRVACGELHSSDPGLSAPTSVPILQANLARILGTSGLLLLGFVFILYLLWRQKHRCFSKSQPSPISTRAQTQAQVRLEGRCLEQGTRGPPQPARKASLATPAPIQHPYEATVHVDQQLPQFTPLLTTPTNPRCLSPQLLRSPSGHGSFISTENGLYASAGETLPQQPCFL